MTRSSVLVNLLVAASIVVALLAATAVTAVVQVRALQGSHRHVTEVSVPEMRHLLETRVAAEAASNEERGFLLSGDRKYIREFEESMSRADASLDKVKEISSPESRSAIEATELRMNQWSGAVRKEFILWDNDPAAARNMALGVNRDLRTQYEEELQQLVDSAVAETRASEQRFRSQAARSITTLVLGVLLGAALAVLVTVRVSRSLVSRLRLVEQTSNAVAAGDLEARVPKLGYDEIGRLGKAVNSMAASLHATVSRLDSEVSRANFATSLGTALDRADDESAVVQVAGRGLTAIDTTMPAELLLADSSVAHLSVATVNPGAGGPGCGVTSPQTCPAVRAGRPLTFESSSALDACAHLAGRPEGSLSALCAPVTFMGHGVGVIHATGPDGTPPDDEVGEKLRTLGDQVGARIGTVRALSSAETQARTDALTGLVNRRETENRLRELASSGRVFATAMLDLDNFKRLNDTHGHEAGDRALRLFAMAAREAVRDSDVIGRWGGEEFLLAMAADASICAETVARVQRALDATVRLAKAPAFTLSAGVADSTMARTVDQQIRVADQALLQAKAAGRNRVLVGGPLPDDLSEREPYEPETGLAPSSAH